MEETMNKNWLKKAGLLLGVFSLLLSPLNVTPVYALSAPTLVAPANTTITTVVTNPPLGIPEFQWAAVTGAISYRLQVSSDIAFTTKILDFTTPNTKYTPPNSNIFSDGTWYWHVSVESPAPASSYSDIWSFTKQWATPSNLPALISPANLATIDFYDQPTFSWGPVTGAAKYKIQIYSSPGGWSSPIYNQTTLTTTHQPNNKLPNGTYYWRVVPVDSGNRDGTPSVERSFTAGYNPVPTLLEPTDNASPTFTPTFRWSAVRGAQFYRLEYTTDPSFNSGVTWIETRNTSFTPINALPNDVNTYWRVRVHSGVSISDWTPTRTFIKRWYIKPVLLTPTNGFQDVRFPVFSWTPVPGASKYKVEISRFPGFSPMYDWGETANTFYTPNNYEGDLYTYYWRVTPYDGNSNAGVASNTSSYRSYFTSLAPQQVYPLFYYLPDTYPPPFAGVTTNPHEDRTVSQPIFIWHRVFVPALDVNKGQVYAEAYRLQVTTDPTFSSVNWSVDTENLTAAPTTANPFTPVKNTNYFWRVRPLIGGLEAGQWSQIWKARFDPDLRLLPTVGVAPTLIRPTNGFEFAEETPLLEWFPLSGADSYDVQISLDQNFAAIVDTASVSYPAYIPTQSLAQRSLGDLNFGVYYWRVRKSGSASWSSPTQRFQIAAQSQWKNTRTLGDAGNQLQIGSDPAGDVAANYDLTSLQVAQSSGYWNFGFHVPSAPTQNVTYALYLDTDHLDSSGATFDGRGYNITTIPSYQPEFIIYVLQESGVFTAAKAYIYQWNGIDWDTVSVLNSIGGLLNKTDNYVELQIPNTAIGYQDTTGSYAISLLSLPSGSGLPQDSVPSDANVPGSGLISRFSNVTERMNLSMPPNDAGVAPSIYPSILPFFWDYPVLSPWSGAIMKAYLDPLFTTEAATYTLTSNTAYYAQTSHAWGNDFAGDNTYYWRIQPRYRDGTCDLCLGAWSQGWRFERQGFVAQNLLTSVTSATPTFSWDMVEGAEYYELQVDDDPNFGSLTININTRQNSYTSTGTLANGTYKWRVRVHRFGNVTNDWTSNQSFTLTLPTPSGLNHNPSGVVGRAPTLCWTPLIVNSLSGDPVLAAWKYRIQVSTEPTFSNPYESTETEQSCWTPTKGYDDGQYYWRIAMLDGEGKPGNYSAYQTFTKQYATTTLVSPTSGSSTSSTPTFVWSPVHGAARYRLETSQFPTFTPTYESVTTDNARWTPTFSYTTNMTYYWRVAIIDSDGKIGPFVGATIILDVNQNQNVKVYIGGVLRGGYLLGAGESTRQNYAGVDSGPVKVMSTDGTQIVSAIREAWAVNGVTTSFFQMMGLPQEQLSDTYVFPGYNNVTLNEQLRISNVDSVSSTVTVTIGGVLRGTYPLAVGEAVRVNYAGLDSGPVVVQGTTGVKIISAIREAWAVNGVTKSFVQLMGLPKQQLSDQYVFPGYNNVTLNEQLRIGNVDSVQSTVTVTIGGVLRGTYTLQPNAAVRVNYAGVDSGPVIVQGTTGVKIISAIREAWAVNGVTTSFAQLMGLPSGQLSNKYVFPGYNNVTLNDQLRIGNVDSVQTTVTVTIGGVLRGTYTLQPNEAVRVNYAGVDSGPVVVEGSVGVGIISAIREAWAVNGVTQSFVQLMGLPSGQLSSTFWFPAYNNVTLNEQLRIAVP
jgi:hypothetical protein